MIQVNIKKLHKDALIPRYAHKGDACFDLHSIEDIKIWPKDMEIINTGISLEIPKGYEGQIRPRSGLALNHLITVFNSPGTIDSGYRGEIKILLLNWNSDPFFIKKGDRIAQMKISQVLNVIFCEQSLEMSESSRGEDGFGSTGVNN